MADVKRGLYEIKQKQQSKCYTWTEFGPNATHGPSPVQKMFRDRTEPLLDRTGPKPGPGPVLTLVFSPVNIPFLLENILHKHVDP